VLKRAFIAAFLAGIWLTASYGQAKVYYVNHGVKYHVGDNRYDRSEDSVFIDAYPVVGQEWIQAFTVSEPDVVKVHIDHLWGLDECPYCKVLVTIDNHDMGRLTKANNYEPFDTLDPLAYRVEPGRTYFLKIASYGTEKVDDFVFEGVSVETAKAEVAYIAAPVIKQPNEPVPTPTPAPPVRGICEGTLREGWLPVEYQSRGWMPLGSEDPRGDEKRSPNSVATGDRLQFFIKVDSLNEGDRVSQALEVLLQDGSGWVLSFQSGGAPERAIHGNLKLDGHYSAPTFAVGAWKQGAWNDLRLVRCTDGKTRLFLNGSELSQSLESLPAGPVSLMFRGVGLNARVSGRPF
jgi:hypothetical protein